jgi:hypothetical protein
LILIGIVVLFIAAVPAGSPTPWAGLLAVATVALLGAVMSLATRMGPPELSFARRMGPPVRQ